MIGVRCSLGSILRHFLKVYSVFVSPDTRKCNHDVPSQEYDKFGEMRH